MIIANGIRSLWVIKNLYILSSSNITDTGAQYLASGFENLKLLTQFELHLENNKISDVGAQYLAAGY